MLGCEGTGDTLVYEPEIGLVVAYDEAMKRAASILRKMSINERLLATSRRERTGVDEKRPNEEMAKSEQRRPTRAPDPIRVTNNVGRLFQEICNYFHDC